MKVSQKSVLREEIPALTPAVRHQLEAADGWLGLDNHFEAGEELARIAPRFQAHPEVLRLRCRVYVAAEKWEMARGSLVPWRKSYWAIRMGSSCAGAPGCVSPR